MLQPITSAAFSDVKLIATDMDGTLTKNEKFTSELFTALESLAANNITVLIVTGRSGGWVSAIAHYLPIAGAIAENGGIFYNNDKKTSELITNLESIENHRSKLKEVFQLLQNKFPEIEESADNSFRLTDWTFDIGNLNLSQLEIINSICEKVGMGFTYSTVQCHIKPKQQEKAFGLQKILNKHFYSISPQEVVTVGDSPNDESLFNSDYFPLSVGVKNIIHYRDRLKHHPAYITTLPEVEGFCEFVDLFSEADSLKK